jgi:hypothetical protein
MDMKKILQAMDGISTKPVEGSNDMAKFLRVVTEGATPHKVALPVQMAMQHYQQPAVKTEPKTRLIDKYFVEAEEAFVKQKEEKRNLINQYASTIAERVMMKEGRIDEKSVSKAQARTMAAAAHSPEFAKKVGIKTSVAKEFNKADAGTKQLSQAMKKKKVKESGEAGWGRVGMAGVGLQPIDEMPIDMTGDPNDPTVYGHEKANPMSLKGRIMSARAQLKELAQLADSNDLVAWEKITQLHKGGMFMGLAQNLEQIRHGIEELAAKRKKGGVQSRGIDKNIGEDNDPCWDSHKMVGTKKKGGKTVPNCVPK